MKLNLAPFAVALAFAAPMPLFAQAAPSAPQATQTTPAASNLPTDQQVAAPAAAPAPSPAAKAAEETEIVELSPFEVSATKDVGYEATETLAGSRIRTNLGDVAASISVYNKDFLDDIGALDTGTLLQYTTNAEVAGTEGSYAGVGNGQTVSEQNNLLNPASAQRVRGLASADNTLDYYITDIPWDSYNVDRVDILRGPNSFLYGLGSPAGIINASLKDAEFHNAGEASFRTGSYGSTRGTIDYNEQIIPGVLAVRVASMYDDRKYEESDAFQNQKRIYGALRFDPVFFKNSSFHTSIKAHVESGNESADRPRILPPADSLTPWWNPVTVSSSNPYGGMGKQLINNPYDPWRTTGVVAGNGVGSLESSTVNYLAWLGDAVNQQQPYWLINGSNAQIYAVNGGYINYGAITSTGSLLGVSSGIAGKGTNMEFPDLMSIPGAATNLQLPGYQYGQYRTMALQNSSVFNFYDNLIDGPTAAEYNKWTAYNVDIIETGFNDRVALELTFDRQHYGNGGQAFLGWQPTLNIDILKNFDDYYLSGADGETSVTNPNLGRPYVTGGGGAGGSSYESTRQNQRASLYAELRASDFTHNDFLVKLLGTHRFNLVASNEQYWNQNLSWQMYANSPAWLQYWNGPGSNDTLFDRPPTAFVYLGPSLLNAASPNGANIPGIKAPITLSSHSVYVFDSTWNSSVSPSASWTVPSSLSNIYYSTTPYTQNSNPANYVGWNSNFVDNVEAYNWGQNNNLLNLAEQQFRETISYAGSYQAYLWNNAVVGTFGWRYDEVETKSVTAQQQPLNSSILNLAPNVYTLPNSFPLTGIDKNHSTAVGLVTHLNDFLPHDFLPFNLNLSFNDSNNFQVTSQRVDVYGDSIPNPQGKTKEYGFGISTKDNRLSLRIVKYDTSIINGTSTLGNPAGIGSAIAAGLRWRNIYLYQLGGYTMSTANEPSYRNTWTNVYPSETASQAQQEEDAAITGWNNIQTYLASKGFFQAWNFTPTGPTSALVNETTYLSNPTLYAPNSATVYSYGATAPQGFTVTSNTESKGYEYELVANPTRNWRISFNAAQTTAVQNDVGGAALNGLVAYMNSQLYNSDGTPTAAGKMSEFGNSAFALGPDVWAPWVQNYTLLKLQQGADVSELRKWRLNLVTNYTFDHGYLKGFGIGGAYRWQSNVVIGYPVNASTGSFLLNQPFYGPAEGYVDLFASYERRLTKEINWKIQLNVTNAFARNGLLPISVEPNGQWASVRIKPVQEWAVTNTFTF